MLIPTEGDAQSLAAAQLRVELTRRQQHTMMVAHEMRNLLAPLTYQVELLTHTDNAASVVARPVIARQVAQMRRLVDDLVDITCADQGRMSLRTTSVDLRDIIAAAIDVARPSIAAREQHLMLADHAAGSAIVDGDPCRLTQVLSNVLINAAKFTPKSGHIDVILERETSCVKVCVRDTGAGIAPDLLPKIFDVYVHTPREPDGPRDSLGLGLGLAVAKNLVESHGGTLIARSDGPGQGSEFVMRLPIAAS